LLQEWGFSAEASFVAAPPVGPDVTVKVLAVADLGQAELDGSMEQSEMMPSLNTTAGLLRDVDDDGYQLLMHNGDISYARGYVTQVGHYRPDKQAGWLHQTSPGSCCPYLMVLESGDLGALHSSRGGVQEHCGLGV